MKKNQKYAPICLFVYNRLEELELTVKALQNNFLATESDLFIFSDGWKKEKDEDKVKKVREFLKSIKGFKKVEVFESNTNKGLANSIIKGVTQIIENYGRVIVLEDDLVTSPNFLNYMNLSLNRYETYSKIFSVSGYTLSLKGLSYLEKDVYLGLRASSWGWGTWKDRWGNVDWEVKDYNSFKISLLSQYKFSRGGSDMVKMLKNQMKGKIDSWAIRWCYNQFKNSQYTVFPKVSKVVCVGFNESATHTTKSTKRFNTNLDTSNKINFLFEDKMVLNKEITKQFRRKFSVFSRIKDKFN